MIGRDEILKACAGWLDEAGEYPRLDAFVARLANTAAGTDVDAVRGRVAVSDKGAAIEIEIEDYKGTRVTVVTDIDDRILDVVEHGSTARKREFDRANAPMPEPVDERADAIAELKAAIDDIADIADIRSLLTSTKGAIAARADTAVVEVSGDRR